MNEGLKEKVAKIVTISLLVIIGSLGALSVWPTYLRGQSLKRQDAELTRRIEEKKREIARLIDFQKRFKTDPDLVERIARQNGRVYPGELVFIFED
jgi:cell division protein FtsB